MIKLLTLIYTQRNYNRKGVCMFNLGYVKESIDLFDMALRLNPEFEEAKSNREQAIKKKYGSNALKSVELTSWVNLKRNNMLCEYLIFAKRVVICR
jgi:tetratricopeptide (TPR) repeat protein